MGFGFVGFGVYRVWGVSGLGVGVCVFGFRAGKVEGLYTLWGLGFWA